MIPHRLGWLMMKARVVVDATSGKLLVRPGEDGNDMTL